MTRDLLGEMRTREYPSRPGGVFLNSAGHGLLPLRAREAIAALLHRRSVAPGVSDEEEERILRRCREAAARMLSVSPAEIALSPNTSFGLNLAAHNVGRGEPGVVVISEGEFPANVFPWLALRARGFQVERIPLNDAGHPDEARIARRLRKGDVRAFGLSAVQFSSGYRADVRRFGALCRKHGVLFVVDATQALGVVPFDAKALQVDVVAAGGQKWLCAPWGSGFTFVDRRLHDAFDPPVVSWLSFDSSSNYETLLAYRYRFIRDGRKFEFGTLGVQDYLGLAVSVELLLEVGIDAIRAHVDRVQAPLVEWVLRTEGVSAATPLERKKRAGIFAFRAPGRADVKQRLRRRGVAFALREGAIRLSPHFYNTTEEMEKVVRILEEE